MVFQIFDADRAEEESVGQCRQPCKGLFYFCQIYQHRFLGICLKLTELRQRLGISLSRSSRGKRSGKKERQRGKKKTLVTLGMNSSVKGYFQFISASDSDISVSVRRQIHVRAVQGVRSAKISGT